MEWLTKIVPGNAPDGAPILSVLGKMTYRFANGKAAWPDEDEQIPFVEADEYWGKGNPQTDAVRLESDLVAFKPMTDVILIGKARPPMGRKATFLDTGVQVGPARKIVRVFGNRKAYVTATGIDFTQPEPFTEMPLDYSLAYGGKDEKSEEGVLYAYPKNPLGKGFVIKGIPNAVQDLALPNLEDPQKLLAPANIALGRFDKWKVYPDPMAFGYSSKSFHPRYTLAGLPPEHWAQAEADRQAGLKMAKEAGTKPSTTPQQVPPMLNPQFFNGASKDLAVPHLRGDETVKLAHLDPDHPQFSFTLPGTRPKAWLDVGQGAEEMPMALHTAVIYKETNQLTLVWRGCAYYGGVEAMKEFSSFDFGVKGG